MYWLVLTSHIIICLLLLIFVLIQHGKGAEAGAAFGSGASNTLFGSQGAMPFLVKMTAILAVLFFVTSLTLTSIGSQKTAPTVSLLEESAPSDIPT